VGRWAAGETAGPATVRTATDDVPAAERGVSTRGWQGVTMKDITAKALAKKPSKYKAVKTTIDGIVFDSKKEAKRYLELKALQAAKKIRDLELQPEFPILVAQKLICTYRADFRYLRMPGDVRVIEDTKGFRTETYRLKRKLVEAVYGITITET
jgi:hypothetical protein